MRSCFFENSRSRKKKIDVASLTPSSEGENTQDEDLKGEISAGTAGPGEIVPRRLYFLYFNEKTTSTNA